MFTQFFGNYLFHKKLVSSEQLSEALEAQKNTKVKLGVLAINAGLMTAHQVDEVHAEQMRVDKRFGDIAVSKGYITEEKVNELLKTQQTGHLLLGQALVDKGYMTNMQFSEALTAYKQENSLCDSDFTDSQNGKIEQVIKSFYHFDNMANSDLLTEYVSLLFKNIIRFIGDDFSPMDPEKTSDFHAEWIAYQKITGDHFECTAAVSSNNKAFIGFAERYANEHLTVNDEFTQACIGEFLNLHNGLFTVNISNDRQMELNLIPQTVAEQSAIYNADDILTIPVFFPFGIVRFLIILGNNTEIR